jgi:hypothetical protein
MSASISANTAAVSSPRTIPRASGVSNGRLQDRSADERSPEPKRQDEAKTVSVVSQSSEVQGLGQDSPPFDTLFEEVSGDEQCCAPQDPSSAKKTPYSVEKRRTARIDLLA